MNTYLDSSLIVKLYFPEPQSELIESFVKLNKIIIPFNHFHDLEICNSIELKEFRNEISHEEKISIFQALEDDKNSGVLFQYVLPWNRVLEKSCELSRKYSCDVGSRTLDIIHVASAICGDFEKFLSYDGRQNRLAEKVGLGVIELK